MLILGLKPPGIKICTGTRSEEFPYCWVGTLRQQSAGRLSPDWPPPVAEGWFCRQIPWVIQAWVTISGEWL